MKFIDGRNLFFSNLILWCIKIVVSFEKIKLISIFRSNIYTVMYYLIFFYEMKK